MSFRSSIGLPLLTPMALAASDTNTQVFEDQELADKITLFFQELTTTSPSSSTSSSSLSRTVTLSPTPSELDSVEEDLPYEMEALSLIDKYPELTEIAAEGQTSFEDITTLAEYLVALKGDLKTQAINHFPALFAFLRGQTPIETVTGLFATIQSLRPTLKEELIKNFSGMLALLKAGFPLHHILTRNPALRTYVLNNAHEIATLKKAGISLGQLLDLKKSVRKEILKNSDSITILLNGGVPFEPILELFSSSFFELPNTRKGRILFRKQAMENPEAILADLEEKECDEKGLKPAIFSQLFDF